jgi:hypothetical protein
MPQQFIMAAFFAIVALAGLFDHHPSTFALIPDPLDTGGYPTIFASLLLASLALSVVRDLRARARGEKSVFPPLKKELAGMMVLVVSYVPLFAYVGFYTATLLFCIMSLFLCFSGEERPGPVYAAAYCAATLLFWVIILKGFNLYLPSGLLL